MAQECPLSRLHPNLELKPVMGFSQFAPLIKWCQLTRRVHTFFSYIKVMVICSNVLISKGYKSIEC